MACKCRNSKEFNIIMALARQTELATKKTVAVYKVPNTKSKISMGYENVVKDIREVCCYYLTDGTEVILPTTKRKRVAISKL